MAERIGLLLVPAKIQENASLKVGGESGIRAEHGESRATPQAGSRRIPSAAKGFGESGSLRMRFRNPQCLRRFAAYPAQPQRSSVDTQIRPLIDPSEPAIN